MSSLRCDWRSAKDCGCRCNQGATAGLGITFARAVYSRSFGDDGRSRAGWECVRPLTRRPRNELATLLGRQGLFFPTGHCKGVCVGGYLLQGGFGWHSRTLGPACQSVIGLDLVTIDGDIVHASPTENAICIGPRAGLDRAFSVS